MLTVVIMSELWQYQEYEWDDYTMVQMVLFYSNSIWPLRLLEQGRNEEKRREENNG